MIWTNESTVCWRIWTNERGPLRHLGLAEAATGLRLVEQPPQIALLAELHGEGGQLLGAGVQAGGGGVAGDDPWMVQP